MHYPDWYRRISQPFRNEAAVQTINVLDKALVYIMAVAYVAGIVMTAAQGNVLATLRVIMVPAATFAIVTYVRDRLDAPRPYELYDIDPIIRKDTRGKSMPSRHVASAVAIACALAWLHADWGVVAFAACIVIAFTRIVGGVHFPRDVAAAAALAIACGAVGFVVLP